MIYERFVFNNHVQEQGEAFDSYVASLRTLSLSCNYGPLREELIRDRIVNGVSDPVLRKHLLQEPNLTLISAFAKGRATESSQKQLKAMTSTSDVHLIKAKSHMHSRKQMVLCKYSGQTHARDKQK